MAARVLVVDDEVDVADVIAETLARVYGFDTLVAHSAEEALARLPEVDVVLMDVVMPGTNGVMARREMAALRPDVPVVLMTGFKQHALTFEALKEPVALAEKPIDYAHVARLIGVMLGR